MVAFNPAPNDPFKPTSMPIYQSATFIQPSSTEFNEYDYTRSGNPTRTALETLVAGMEGSNCDAAFAFSTGMAALGAMTRILKAGDEILCNADIYGGMYRLLGKVVARNGVSVKFVESWNIDNVVKAISSKTRIVHIESPSNPLMHVTDIRKLSAFLHSKSILLTVDNTIMTPYLMKPLDLGADIVVHSATKFFGGHADTMAGFVCCKSKEHSKVIAFHQNAEGIALSPFDCFLMLRGIKTMPIRMDRGMSNALKVAEYLAKQPGVKKLHYAGFLREEDRLANGEKARAFALHKTQARGAGVLLSFETGDIQKSQKFVDALKIFKITVSFGGCGSVVEMPCNLSHASIPEDELVLPRDLVRMSVGVEDIGDLLADVENGLRAMGGSIVAAPSRARL